MAKPGNHDKTQPAAAGNARLSASIIPIILYLILSVLFSSAFFSWTNLESHSIQGGDPALNAWVLQRVTHQLITDPLHPLDGNAYYPESNSLKYWDHLTSLGLINIFFRALSDSPWFGYNLLIFLAYFISAVGGYRLGMTLTGNRLAAFWAGLFWGFMFFRAHHFTHLQILSFQWMPFCVEALISFLKTEKNRHLARLTIFTLLQSLVGWYLAVINGFLLLVVFVFLISKKNLNRDFFAKCLSGGLVFLCVMLPFILAYMEPGSTEAVEHRSSEIGNSSEQVLPLDYLHPPAATLPGQLMSNDRYSIWGEQTLYIGFIPLLLAMAGFWFSPGKRRRFESITSGRMILLSVGLILTGGIFALGHNSQTLGIPLPWHFVCEAVPYLGLIRATARFSLLIYMGILLMSVAGLHCLLGKTAGKRRQFALTAVFSILFLIEVFPVNLPFKTDKPFQYKPVDIKIAEAGKQAGRELIVVHLLPSMSSAERELFRENRLENPYAITYPSKNIRKELLPQFLLGSTAHWSRLLGGISFFRHQSMHYRGITNLFPDYRALSLLNLYNVDLVVFYEVPEMISGTQFKEMIATAGKIGDLTQVEDGKYVLEINRNSLDEFLSRDP